MNRAGKIILIVLAVIAAVYAAAVKFAAPVYLAQVPALVESLAGDYINGSVTLEKFDWNGRLTFTAYGVTVRDADGEVIAEVPEAEFGISPLSALIAPERALSEVILRRPQLNLIMNGQDEWNLRDFLKPSDSDETPFYGFIDLQDGVVNVATPHGAWQFGVDAQVDGGGNPHFAVDGSVTYGEEKLKLMGVVDTSAQGRLNLKTERFTLTPFAAFAEALVPLENCAGALEDVDLIWENDGSDTRLSGKGEIVGLTAAALLNGEKLPLELNGRFELAGKELAINGMRLAVNGSELRIDGALDYTDMDNLQGGGMVQAQEIALGAQKITALRLPFTVVESRVMLDEAGFDFSGGHLRLDGEYNLHNNELFAVLNAGNIVDFALPDYPLDTVGLDGLVAVHGTVGGAEGVRLTVAGNMERLSWRDLVMSRVDFEADVDSEGCTVKKFAAFSAGGVMNFTGYVDTELAFSGSGRMLDFPLDTFFNAVGQNGSGTATAGFNFSGTPDSINFYAMSQLKNIHIMGLVFPEAHGAVEIADSVLRLTDYHVAMEQGYNLINGWVDIGGGEPVLDLTVETSGIRAEPLMAAFAPDFKLTGNIDNEITITGPLSAPEIDGSLLLTEGSAEGFLVDEISGLYTYSHDGSVRLTGGHIKALSTEADLSGTMDVAQNLNFSLDITDMDLSRLPISDATVDLDGFVSAHGSLTGTLRQPQFSGSINSRSVFINGEELKNIEGMLVADGGHNNRMECSFEQSPDGLFAAELALDTVDRNINGNLEFMYGNLRSILKMAGVDLDIDGTADGRMVINPQGKGSGIVADMRIADITVKDVAYDSMRFKGRLHRGVLNFDELKLTERGAAEGEEQPVGTVAAAGWVNLMDHTLDIKAQAVNANPAIIPALAMDEPLALGGALNMDLQLGGSLEDPVGSAVIELLNGTVEDIGFDAFTARLSVADDNLKLDEALLTKDVYRLSAAGDMPLDLLRAKEERRNPDAAMNIKLNLDNARLSLLHLISPVVEWGEGQTVGEITLAGTLEEPLVYGGVELNGGALKLTDADTIFGDITLDVDFTGNEITLHNFSMQMGKGTVTAAGNYALRAEEDKSYVINAAFKDAEFASEIFSGVLNGTAGIIPQRHFIRPEAEGQRPQIGYRPLIKADVRLDDVLVNMPTIPEMSEGSSNYGLDVTVTLGPKIHLYNKYLYDLWLAGGLHITGSTVYTNIDGNVKVDRGTITYLRTPFKIQNASVAWPVPGDVLPTVNLDATGRFRRYDIFLRVTGPVEEMELILRSDPALTRDQIIKMLTLQREVTGTGQDVTQDDMQNLLTVGLEMTVLGDVEELFKDTLGLDEFTIYSGRLRTGHSMSTRQSDELTGEEKEQYNILVSKYLTNSLKVGYTVSSDSEHESIFGQYDISRHMSVNYERNKDYDTTDNWYGLEYKVSF